MLTFITIKNVYTIVTVNCCFLTKLVLMLSRLFYKTREILAHSHWSIGVLKITVVTSSIRAYFCLIHKYPYMESLYPYMDMWASMKF